MKLNKKYKCIKENSLIYRLELGDIVTFSKVTKKHDLSPGYMINHPKFKEEFYPEDRGWWISQDMFFDMKFFFEEVLSINFKFIHERD